MTALANNLFPFTVKKTRVLGCGFLILGLLLSAAGCSKDADSIISVRGTTMGTSYQIKVRTSAKNQNQIAELIDQTLQSVNKEVNHYDSGSQISLFNRSGIDTPVKAGPIFAESYRLSRRIWDKTDGALDVTAGKLYSLWGFGPGADKAGIPQASAIEEAMNVQGHQYIFLKNNEIKKSKDGLELNLSSVAKGLAVDILSRELSAQGYKHHMIEIGGEVFAIGESWPGKKWTIGVLNPKTTHNNPKWADKVALNGKGLATSGNYSNYFEIEGKRYAHLIDPRSRYPVSDASLSVSVIADSCAKADAAATAIAVMGAQKGFEWIQTTSMQTLIFYTDSDGKQKKLQTAGWPSIN